MTYDGGDLLVRRLGALSDHRQRVAILAEEAERLGMEAFADLLAVVISRASGRKSEHDHLAMRAVMGYLDSEHLDRARRARLLAACHVAGYRQLMHLLFVPRSDSGIEIERVPDYGTGRPLTLGERKSLARRPSRQVLERVMADPHPAVIHNLLRNPKLTEADVMRLASRRPNYAAVLQEVYQSERWGRRYPIKKALVRNPHTPPALALKLLPQLMRQDLKELLEDRGLHPSVLVSCRRLLEGEDPDRDWGPSGDDDSTLH